MLALEQERSTTAVPAPAAAGEFVALWFALARREWTSLVVVPVDPGSSSAELASALAEAGKHLDEVPVTAISLTKLAPATARAIADLERQVERAARRSLPGGPTVAATATIVDPGDDADPSLRSDSGRGAHAQAVPAGRVVISIPSVVEEPLGLALTQASSLVVVAIELGRTRLADARRTIELIGRERIAGCVLV